MASDTKATARPCRCHPNAPLHVEVTASGDIIRLAPHGEFFATTRLDPSGELPALHPARQAVRATLIVRAVNAHDALVAALEVACQAAMLNCPNGADNGKILPLDAPDGNVDFPAIVAQARAALALARGEREEG